MPESPANDSREWWLSTVITFTSIVLLLAITVFVFVSGDAPARRKKPTVLMLLPLEGERMTRMIGQYAGAAAALQELKLSSQIDLRAVHFDKDSFDNDSPLIADAEGQAMNLKKVILILGPSYSEDAEEFVKRVNEREELEGVPTVIVSATARRLYAKPRLPRPEGRYLYMASMGNTQIAELMVNEAMRLRKNASNKTCYIAHEDEKYGNDLTNEIERLLSANGVNPEKMMLDDPAWEKGLDPRKGELRKSIPPNRDMRESTIILAATTSKFLRKQRPFGLCKNLVLSDGLASENVRENLLLNRCSDPQWKVVRMQSRANESKSVTRLHWGRLTFRTLSTALGTRESGSEIGTPVRKLRELVQNRRAIGEPEKNQATGKLAENRSLKGQAGKAGSDPIKVRFPDEPEKEVELWFDTVLFENAFEISPLSSRRVNH